MTHRRIRFPLFLPADRMDRLGKALAAGADAVILDLEDGVAPGARAAARDALARALESVQAATPIWLRINAAGTADHAADLALVRLPGLAGVMLPKTEVAEDLRGLKAAMEPGRALIGLVETARGLASARALAAECDQMAFGSVDYAADLRMADDRLALLSARSELVLAARLAGRPGPLDGVTTALDDAPRIEDDARHATMLGFAGKLLIHPAQIAPTRRGFAPTAEELDWARRILATSAGPQAVALGGEMIDAPVLLRARAIVEREEGA